MVLVFHLRALLCYNWEAKNMVEWFLSEGYWCPSCHRHKTACCCCASSDDGYFSLPDSDEESLHNIEHYGTETQKRHFGELHSLQLGHQEVLAYRDQMRGFVSLSRWSHDPFFLSGRRDRLFREMIAGYLQQLRCNFTVAFISQSSMRRS